MLFRDKDEVKFSLGYYIKLGGREACIFRHRHRDTQTQPCREQMRPLNNHRTKWPA